MGKSFEKTFPQKEIRNCLTAAKKMLKAIGGGKCSLNGALASRPGEQL